jgi:hypothetical protein
MAIIRQIASFITPHGFGHAARACAVLSALQELAPAVHCHIFTRVPEWFFAESLSSGYTYHRELTDIGLIQTTSLDEDLQATLTALEGFYPLREKQISALCRKLEALEIDAIHCDIAPLGLVLGMRLGIPTFLVENFTWDWIYAGYLELAPALERFIALHREYNALADVHIQALPPCNPNPTADLTVQPISREPTRPPKAVRKALQIPPERQTVLVTMGGVQEKYDLMGAFKGHPGIHFILPGSTKRLLRRQNVIQLPYHSPFFHPNLVHMADAVIGKTGYSTMAEVFHAGVPFGYINRENFRESEIMSAFIRIRIPGLKISQSDFFQGAWLDQLPALLSKQKATRRGPNGAHQVAEFLLQSISG